MKIAVAGVGYVGLSLAVLLSQHDEVYAVSTTPAKVELINSGKSPIKDKEIEEYLASRKLNLTATTDKEGAYRDAEFVVIATPTNYDPDKNYFDTSSSSPPSLSAIPKRYAASSAARTSSSPRSFCAKAAHCMITSIPHV